MLHTLQVRICITHTESQTHKHTVTFLRENVILGEKRLSPPGFYEVHFTTMVLVTHGPRLTSRKVKNYRSDREHMA